MLKSLGFAATCLLATPAAALTCLQPTIVDSFEQADARPEAMVVALGALERIGADVPDGPDTGDPNDRVGYSFPARFTGGFAASDTFGPERSVDVMVEVQCVAAWCGGDPVGSDMLFFFRVDSPDDYTFESTVCPLYAFPDPTSHELQSLFGLIAER